jgi:hypothetical protein
MGYHSIREIKGEFDLQFFHQPFCTQKSIGRAILTSVLCLVNVNVVAERRREADVLSVDVEVKEARDDRNGLVVCA